MTTTLRLEMVGRRLGPHYVLNKRLVVDAVIFSGYGFTPAKVIANELSMQEPSWDRNYDDTALEVVNARGIPMLQIIYTTRHNVLIYEPRWHFYESACR